jgi:hypothetical protein
MNSAFTDNQAASKAVRIARTALRGALACALVFGAGFASAQQYGERRDDQQQQHQGGRERFSLPQQDRGQREQDPRAYGDQGRGQQAQAQQQQQQYAQPPRENKPRDSGRLTPDERRDLRRQINEAGMDLYPRKRDR